MIMHKEVRSVGISFSEALTIAFIVLKLTGVVNWSWLWVLCPIWITADLVALLSVVVLILKRLTES